jgi:predicted glycosyltransferase
MAPEVLPENAVRVRADRVLRYPGIKEDVYVPCFRPDPTAMGRLGITGTDIVVTVRPPATNAHYHNPESERLLAAAIEFVSQHPTVKMVLLPRYPEQERSLRASWSALFASGRMLIPEHVVDGLNLIWYSDLVMSGGGTMNREAAALGVPAYSIFRGKIGAVDQYLCNCGRLVLLESVEQISQRVVIAPHARPEKPQHANSATLEVVIGHILRVLALTSKPLH